MRECKHTFSDEYGAVDRCEGPACEITGYCDLHEQFHGDTTSKLREELDRVRNVASVYHADMVKAKESLAALEQRLAEVEGRAEANAVKAWVYDWLHDHAAEVAWNYAFLCHHLPGEDGLYPALAVGDYGDDPPNAQGTTIGEAIVAIINAATDPEYRCPHCEEMEPSGACDVCAPPAAVRAAVGGGDEER